jgi:hypothetical protein
VAEFGGCLACNEITIELLGIMKNYTIIRADSKENLGILRYREAITCLWKTNLARPFENRFEWLYRGNPSGSANTWLSIYSDDKVVGGASLCPHEICIKGHNVRVGIAIDFAINKEHRVYGPALKLQRAVASQLRACGLQFALAFPNKAAAGVFLRAGYQPLGEVSYYVRWIRSERKIAPYLKIPFVARQFGRVIDAMMQIVAQGPFGSTRKYRDEVLRRGDERFNRFWGQMRDGHPITVDKRVEYLNWRYADCKNDEHRFYCISDIDTREVKGCVVYSVNGQIATVVNLIVPRNGKILVDLISGFCKKLYRDGIGSVVLAYLGDDWLGRNLKRLGFYKRKTGRNCMLYLKVCPEEIRLLIVDKNNWLLFEGDLDL